MYCKRVTMFAEYADQLQLSSATVNSEKRRRSIVFPVKRTIVLSDTIRETLN